MARSLVCCTDLLTFNGFLVTISPLPKRSVSSPQTCCIMRRFGLGAFSWLRGLKVRVELGVELPNRQCAN